MGSESAGVPDEVADAVDARIRIPMKPGLRSLNVALAASMVLGEALRQTALPGLHPVILEVTDCLKDAHGPHRSDRTA